MIKIIVGNVTGRQRVDSTFADVDVVIAVVIVVVIIVVVVVVSRIGET